MVTPKIEPQRVKYARDPALAEEIGASASTCCARDEIERTVVKFILRVTLAYFDGQDAAAVARCVAQLAGRKTLRLAGRHRFEMAAPR